MDKPVRLRITPCFMNQHLRVNESFSEVHRLYGAAFKEQALH